MNTPTKPICVYCRREPALDGHEVCWDCGAELYDQMRADQAVAEHDAGLAMVAAGEAEEWIPGDEIPF